MAIVGVASSFEICDTSIRPRSGSNRECYSIMWGTCLCTRTSDSMSSEESDTYDSITPCLMHRVQQRASYTRTEVRCPGTTTQDFYRRTFARTVSTVKTDCSFFTQVPVSPCTDLLFLGTFCPTTGTGIFVRAFQGRNKLSSAEMLPAICFFCYL